MNMSSIGRSVSSPGSIDSPTTQLSQGHSKSLGFASVCLLFRFSRRLKLPTSEQRRKHNLQHGLELAKNDRNDNWTETNASWPEWPTLRRPKPTNAKTPANITHLPPGEIFINFNFYQSFLFSQTHRQACSHRQIKLRQRTNRFTTPHIRIHQVSWTSKSHLTNVYSLTDYMVAPTLASDLGFMSPAGMNTTAWTNHHQVNMM